MSFTVLALGSLTQVGLLRNNVPTSIGWQL